MPLSEGVLRYNYVVLSSKQPRTEARVAERAVALKGLAPGSVLHVHDSFRSPKIASIASSCFSRAIFGRGHQAGAPSPTVADDRTIVIMIEPHCSR